MVMGSPVRIVARPVRGPGRVRDAAHSRGFPTGRGQPPGDRVPCRPMNFTLRPIRPTELDAVHDLYRRVEEHDGVPIATPREEIQEWLDEPHFDLATDSRLATV